MKGKLNAASIRVKIIVLLSLFAFIGVQAQQNSLNVIVLEFNRIDSISFPKTDVAIASYIGNYLSTYDQKINIKQASGQITDAQVDSLSKGLAITGLNDVDLIVFGSYVIENRYVNIQPLIYDVSYVRFYSLSMTRGILDDENGVIQRVSKNVADKFMEISPKMRQSLNKVAILSNFKQVPGSSRKVVGKINKLSEKYTKKLIENIDYDGVDFGEIIPWSDIVKYDQSRMMIVDSLKPDLLINIVFLFDSLTPVSFRTDFLVFEKNETRPWQFELPEIKADHYSEGSINFEDFIYYEIDQFLNRIIDIKGKLDRNSFTKLKSLRNDDKSLVYSAEKYAVNNDFYLSSICYYMALNNEDESVSLTDIHLQMGLNKIYMFRLEEAREEFDFVLERDPKNGYAFVGKSLIYYFSDAYEDNESNIENAKKTLLTAKENGLDNELIFEALMGYYEFNLDNYQDAIVHFQKAAAADRSDLNIRISEKLSIEDLKIHIGLCYVNMARYDEAIDFFQKLKVEFPVNLDIPYYIGTAFSSRGTNKYFKKDYAGAIADLNASKENYADSDMNDYIRLSMVNLNQFSEAIVFIQQEIDKGNYDASFIWKQHARDLKKMMLDKAAVTNQYDDGIGKGIIGSLNKSLEVYPNDPMAFYNLGEVYTLLGDNERSLEYMQKAASADPLDFEIRLGLMQSYLLMGNYTSCIDEYKDFSSRKNRKYFDGRTTVLMEFFNASAVSSIGKQAKKEIKRIDKELAEGTVISGWYFAPYANWLQNCPCEDGAKSSLSDLLEKIKATQKG